MKTVVRGSFLEHLFLACCAAVASSIAYPGLLQPCAAGPLSKHASTVEVSNLEIVPCVL